MLSSRASSSGCNSGVRAPWSIWKQLFQIWSSASIRESFSPMWRQISSLFAVQYLSIYAPLSWFICGLQGIISIWICLPSTPSVSHIHTHKHTHTQHIPQSFALIIMRLGSAPAWLKLINSGFNSPECWVQTRQLCVLKHAPSSLIIKMCVLEKLMNKSLGGDYDWCVRNKQARIGCCRNQCAGQTNCRWTDCWIKQTAHSFHHMCVVFLMADYSYVVSSLNMLLVHTPRGMSHRRRHWSSVSLRRELMFCFPESQILGLLQKFLLALRWKEKRCFTSYTPRCFQQLTYKKTAGCPAGSVG